MTVPPAAGPTINRIFRENRHLLKSISADEDRAVNAIVSCRTAARGGSVRHCLDCEKRHFAYHSCGNRHCPLCQHEARERWVEARMSELLPVPYFHVVFPLPSELRALALRNKRVVYGILMRKAWETLRELGRSRLKAELGAIMILHTWGQAVTHHPHVHIVVPGGGIDENGRWRAANSKYLLNVDAMKETFRAKFLEALEKAYEKGELGFSGRCEEYAKPAYFAELLRACARRKWVMKIKRPFASPRIVLRYISNYTHRVAISNNRIVRVDAEGVTFTLKDYKDGGRRKQMTLPIGIFMRRFLMHVLPKGFVKIRFMGWMAHPVKGENLRRLREHLGAHPPRPRAEEKTAPFCPHCGGTRVVIVGLLAPIRTGRPASIRIDDTS